MTTLTATSAAEQLLADVRLLLARHDRAESLDDLRELADELSTALRRVRGRISRLAKKDNPADTQAPAGKPPRPDEPQVTPPKPPDNNRDTAPDTRPAPVTPAKPPGMDCAYKQPVTDQTLKVPIERTPVTQPTPYPAANEPTASPKKKRHIFRWFFLAVQLLFLAWIIFGVGGAAAENCDGETGAALEACQAGTAVGASIGAGLIIGLWVAVDIILGLTYLIFRKR